MQQAPGIIWRHLGGIWKASGRHLEASGGIWEASGRHLEVSGLASGIIWSHLESSGVIWSHLD